MILAWIILFGLMIGSFLNVCIYRIPQKESIVHPRSHCPQCNYQLKAWENVPVLSYLILKGRCSNCHTRISPRYMLVEVLTSLVYVITYVQFGPTWDFVAFAAFLSLVIVITFIDIDHQIIPNRLLLLGLIPGIYPLIRDGVSQSKPYLAGALGLGLGFLAIGYLGSLAFKKESMGMGDVKYAALIGLILGWKGGLVATALAFLSAASLFILLMPFGKLSFGQQVPFGPFLSLGALLALLWGPHIIDWYINFVI